MINVISLNQAITALPCRREQLQGEASEKAKEAVEIDTSINKEENDQMVKVVFIAKKSLIPCRF